MLKTAPAMRQASFIHHHGREGVQQDVSDIDPGRMAWWFLVCAAIVIVGVALYLYLAALSLGLFVYYAARPVDRWVQQHGISSGPAAIITVAIIVIPIIVLVLYVGVLGFQAISDLAGGNLDSFGTRPTIFSILSNPQQLLAKTQNTEEVSGATQTSIGILGAVARVVVQLFVALAFVTYLLRDDEKLARWFRSQIGGKDSVAYAYLSAVDRDLKSVYFGNVLTILIVTVVALVLYNGFNLLSPSGLTIPVPVVLAILTGLTSIVPLVVSKLVYIPIALYLGFLAVRSDATLFVPMIFIVVSFVFLDIIPQTAIQPYLAGRETHVGLMLFSYIAGPAIFGWYGLFLGPFLLVVVVQVFRIVFPELIHGKRLTPTVTVGKNVGSDPDTSYMTPNGSSEDEVDSTDERP
jgi:predicted PurR-regulated permease PerM